MPSPLLRPQKTQRCKKNRTSSFLQVEITFLLLISLLLSHTNSRVQAARREYLYHALPNGDGDPIRDYHKDGLMEPNFLYQPDYPKHRVVEFYSPMCPHCVHFAPHYIEFARKFHGIHNSNNNNSSSTVATINSPYKGIDVEFHAVSCLKFRDICKQQNIHAYPTIKIFPQYSNEGTFLRYTNLHPMTLVKALGVSLVEDSNSVAPASTATTKTTVGASSPGETETESDIATTKEIPAFGERTAREIFADASLSFYHLMKTAVFIDENGSAGSKERQEVLFKFLQLLQEALPPLRLHQLLQGLLGTSNKKKEEMFYDVLKSEQVWTSILEKHPPLQDDWSNACQLHDSPLTCGMWTLFHITTVGVVEYNSALTIQDLRKYLVIDPSTTADTIKDFIQHFFLCHACATHFVQEYNDCKYGRCDRLSTTKPSNLLKKSTNVLKKKSNSEYMKEWRELPLWLLETHNGVNLRLDKERKEEADIAYSPNDQQTVLWPPVRECSNCWVISNNSTISSFQEYNHTMMYNYLRLIYWPEDSQSLSIRKEVRLSVGAERMSHGDIATSTTTTTITPTTEEEAKGQNILTLSVEMQYALVGVLVWVSILFNKRRIERVLGISLGGKAFDNLNPFSSRKSTSA